jgi:hypothetical protein
MREGFADRRACAAGAWVFAAAAVGQPLPLERVTPGIGDVGPSSVDLRVPQIDLRHPLDFDAIYRLGRRDPRQAFDTRPLVRVSGATIAVFPRSTYALTRGGPVATVPAGTIFYLGTLPPELLGDGPHFPASPLAVSLASRRMAPLDTSAGQSPRETPDLSTLQAVPTPEAPPNDILVNERYRRARIAQLLRQAAEAP